MKKLDFWFRGWIAVAIAASRLIEPIWAAEQRTYSPEQERKLIAVLQSDAPPQDKAITCKQLAVFGGKDAVPSLAPLLANPDLASWARIAIEAIPGPEADEALRSAIPKLDGLLLIGAINSIGVRRDAKAVSALADKLNDSNAEIVAAAAVALGKIGGVQSAKILNQALGSSRAEVRSVVAEGGILCAEHLMAEGKMTEAGQLYDAVRNADVPKQRRLEATRGAVLARQSSGIPLLLEQLRSADKPAWGMGLRTARELPGRDVTEALGAELDRSSPERQVMLVFAIADRNDPAVVPKLLGVAQKGSKPARVASLGLLDRFGDVNAVPVLLNSAAESDEEVAKTAKATLTRMEGKQVDAALLARLPNASGKARQTIIELAALRRIEGILPAVVASMEDPDPAIRRAALNTLSVLGTEQQADALVRLLSKSKEDREAIEKALTAICGRAGTRSVPRILPLTRHTDAELRKVGVRTLASIGGAEAVAGVKAALDDRDESVQDEAVSTLATWPNNWPDDSAVAEPLLKLANSGKKNSHRVQAVRGYLLCLQENKKLSATERLTALQAILPALKQPQEKRLAIATLNMIAAPGALEVLVGLAQDQAVAEEASLAIVNMTTGEKPVNAPKEVRTKALQTVLAKSKNESTRGKAADALK